MAVTFDADEIFEMAEQIERNGVKFYRKAAKGISNMQIRKLLEELADMEVDHEKTFSAMRADIVGTEHAVSVFDPDDEVGLYLRALADGRIFDVKADPSEKLTGSETPQHILKIAIALEKESVIFYLGLEEYVPPEAGKDRVRDIIKQEMGHIALLSEKLTH